MKKYLVQAILQDGEIEKVTDSFKTDDYQVALELAMRRHKASNKYLYVVLDTETQEVIYKSAENKFSLW